MSGPCGEVHHQRTLTVAATPHLRVAHIEVSQGLQDAAHTVRLVTGRTTGVRAYLTSGLVGFSYTGGPDEVPNVTGTLYVERAGVVVGSIPAAAPVSVRAGYADSHRSGTPATLLFLVPGWLMDGDVTMRVTAKAAGLPGFGSAAPATSQSRTVRTERGGAVTVVRLRMRLTNPAHPAAQATEEDWRASAMGARDRYPIGDTGMTVGAPSTGDVLPTDHFLGKPAGWHDALDDLDDYADRFDDITSVYACIVPNLDYGPESLNGTAHHEYVFWPVLVNRRCFLSRSLLQATFAHEMAHTLGVGHAPCGKDVEGIDERLPGRTEPGVVGWRRSNGHLIPPDWPELMSYCTPPEGATTFAPPGGHGKGTGVYDDRWPSVALWDLLLDKLT